MNDLPATLDGMLARIEQRSPISRIELGLDRVGRVLDRLAPDLSNCRIVSVAGTNGKGSTVAFVEAIGRAAGRRTLAFSSPHVVAFGERYRLDGQPLSDAALHDALVRVERAREDVPLTWFEHITLACFDLAGRLAPDWLIAEVGMGGRLDAVNAVDADLAVITSIGLDHQRFLGRTRAAIAREKCGIARSGRPVVVGEKDRPEGMVAMLTGLGAKPLLAGVDFDFYWRRDRLFISLPGERLGGLVPGIPGRYQRSNAACAALAVRQLEPDLPAELLEAGLRQAALIGRFQRVAEDPDVIVDVAHNPAAARVLAEQLERLPGRNLAVFGVLEDKDVAGIARAMAPAIARWFVATLDVPRGLDAAAAVRRAPALAGRERPEALESVGEAIRAARAACRPGDRVIVFGSFMTAAAAFDALEAGRGTPTD